MQILLTATYTPPNPPPHPRTQLYDHLPVNKKNSSNYKPPPNVLKLIIDSIYSIYYGVLKLNQNQ